MRQRRIATFIFQYHNLHGIISDNNANWYLAERFLADDYWNDEIKKARIWEKRHGVRYHNRVDEKMLVWRWLDNVIYSHDGSDPIRPTSLWQRITRLGGIWKKAK